VYRFYKNIIYYNMQNYIIVGLIVTVVVVIIMKNDLINLKSSTNTDNDKIKIKKMLQLKKKNKQKNKKKRKKIEISESSEILDDSSEDPFSDLSSSSDSSDDDTESDESMDETEVSFDTSDKKSNVNSKLLNDFKKFIMQKQNKHTTDRKKNEKKVNKKINDSNDSKNKVKSRSKNKLKIKTNEIKQEDIHKMHKLAKELNKKKIIELAKQHPNANAKIVEETKTNASNYDLTDTINRIIQMELQNNSK